LMGWSATGVIWPSAEALQRARASSRCLIPGFDGAVFSQSWKNAPWARFNMAAPQRRRRSV
jgi:hypothetical protein